MLNFAIPRPSTDAVSRSAGAGPLLSASPAVPFAARWSDDAEPPPRRWSRAEVEALEQKEPPLSPWRVVAAQAGVGVVAALVASLFGGVNGALSALYGAAVVALPGLLVARAATGRVAGLPPALVAARLLGWGFVKIAVSFLMLATAQRWVPGLSWPVMLVTLFITLQTYWFALLVRARAS